MILYFALSLLGCSRGQASQEAAGPPSVTTRVVEERAFSTKVPVRATLEATQDVELRARTSAFVDERLVDVGARVRKGDVLVRLSAPDLVAKSVSADAELHKAEVRLAHLEEAARADGVVAPTDLETLRSDVQARRAESQGLASQVRDLTVRAPFEGVVTARGADPGTLVGTAGTPALVHLTQVDPLRLVAAVPERFINSLAPGTAVDFTVAALPKEVFHVEVSRAAASLDASTRSLRVEFDVPNAKGRLMPGMYAEVSWPIEGGAGAVFVPATAIVRSTEGVYVVAVRDGKLSRVDVKPGLADGTDTEVTGELRAGEMVVARGSEDLIPGVAVNAVPEAK